MIRALPVLLLLVLLLAAPRPAAARDIPGDITYTPDGSAAYAITCNGPFDDMQLCQRRAAEICRETGYDVVQSSSRDRDLPDPIGQMKRSMTVRCRTPDGLYPGDQRQR